MAGTMVPRKHGFSSLFHVPRGNMLEEMENWMGRLWEGGEEGWQGIGSIPSLDQDEDELTPIPGTPPSLVNPPDGCPFEPRCNMAIEQCLVTEPELVPTERPGHLAACHRWEDLVGLTDELKAFRRPVESQGAN